MDAELAALLEKFNAQTPTTKQDLRKLAALAPVIVDEARLLPESSRIQVNKAVGMIFFSSACDFDDDLMELLLNREIPLLVALLKR